MDRRDHQHSAYGSDACGNGDGVKFYRRASALLLSRSSAPNDDYDYDDDDDDQTTNVRSPKPSRSMRTSIVRLDDEYQRGHSRNNALVCKHFSKQCQPELNFLR
ncbi:hypothetical protein M0804_004391 [Polistes exclamans]|nr:hypothetical protein M0804_004391 [Polistes exclamans]